MIENNFKQTELGPIPEDWEVGTFADFLTTFSAGATPYRGIPDNFIGQIPWISSGELNYCEINDTREHISLDAQRNTHLTVHKPGTFLIAITGLEAAGTRGRCAFVKTPSTTNQSCLAINSTDKMTVKYLFWFYRQWSDYLAFNFSQGSKQQSFTAEIAKKLPIYAPTYNEQVAIAEALNDADALILELDTLIEKKKAVLQGTMQELLTGKRRLPGFGMDWKEIKLMELVSMNSGGTPSTSMPEYYSGNIPFLSISDISNTHKFLTKTQKLISEEALRDTSARLYPKGTLLLSMYASIGKVCVSLVDVAISQAILGFTPIIKDISVEYLYYVLCFCQKDLAGCGQTGTQSNLNKRIVQNFTINIPSDVKEQHVIASILSDMDAEIAELEAKREKYKAIRQGMMQQLLTGKIRLI